MATLIFDIETIGEEFDSLDATTQEMLTKWIKKESANDKEYRAELEDIKNGLGFSPLTGEIVAIGILDGERSQGAVWYQSPGTKEKETQDGNMKFKPMGEKEMLDEFWRVAQSYDTFVTFNGRSFDAPFLMVRSAVHGIRPSKDLMSNRYATSQRAGATHIDLLDQLSFYGAVRKKGSLHFWSRAFGIPSPKAGGVTGDDVGFLFKEKRFLDIARYNVGDLVATRELYDRWQKYIRM